MIKKKMALFGEKIKKLNGDPHYVALGMAIGIFVAITPTIPFHTALAIALALLLKASKPAAILGVWVSNPFTVVFFYFACYKTGHFFFEDSGQALESIKLLMEHLGKDIDFSQQIYYLTDFVKTKIRIFMIMNVGGVILGLPAGLAAYFITRHFFGKLKQAN